MIVESVIAFASILVARCIVSKGLIWVPLRVCAWTSSTGGRAVVVLVLFGARKSHRDAQFASGEDSG